MSRGNTMYEIMGQDATGSAGGLAIIWNPEEIQFENWISLPRILSGTFKVIGSSEWVVLSGVYGPHSLIEQKGFLQNLKAMRRLIPEKPWIIGGDFNMITTLEEKSGGLRRIYSNMEAFRDMISEQRMVDIQTINGNHTWNNRRGGTNQIASRLDRFLISEKIMMKYVFIEATILPVVGSDHWLIKLEIDLKQSPKRRLFMFEAFWLRDQMFLPKIEEWWTKSRQSGRSKMQAFQLKLKELRGKIKKWNKEEFGDIFKEQQRLEHKMSELQ